MNKTKLSTLFKSVQTAMYKHSPEILTGIGIAGMITTTVLAVKATPKAIKIIEEHEETEKMPTAEKVKLCWKCYIPAAVTGTASIACLIGASSVNFKRNAALAAAYKLSETTLSDYREKVVETIGEKKEKDIRDEIAKDKIVKNPVNESNIIITGKGDTLCYDIIGGQYFKSDIDRLRKIENELNRRMRDEMSISLNEFYYEVELPGIGIGDSIGWNIDKGYIEMDFSSQLTPDGRPCLVINFRTPPIYNFM